MSDADVAELAGKVPLDELQRLLAAARRSRLRSHDIRSTGGEARIRARIASAGNGQ